MQAGRRGIAGLFFFLAAGLFFFLAAALAGCSLLPADRQPLPPSVSPAKALIQEVPFFPQEELQCGPAALAMALHWSGISVPPAELTPEVFSPGLGGSLQSALIGAARRHGRVAYPLTGREAMLAEVAAGHPVIVLVNLGFFWFPKWHYAVVIGYDQPCGEIILHSGRTAGEHLDARVFLNIWQRGEYWGLLIMPPQRLPAGGEEDPWLAAVAGLERTGQWSAAATGYAAALQRWPESFAAWMALGNSRYGQGDLPGAAGAFRRAGLLQPENGMACNNLAQVLAEQGKHQEALLAAQQAVARGGPLLARFRQTLEEIKAGTAPAQPGEHR